MAAGWSGGLRFDHATDGKQLTHRATAQTFAPSRLILPLTGRFGQTCRPTVAVGDTVLVGQTVGEPTSAGGLYLHSGVSGRVEAIRLCETEEGMCPAVVIRNDFEDRPAPPFATDAPLPELLDRAGVVGMGGAGFPAGRKYRTDRPIDTVLINGCECEPFLSCDHRLMLEHPDRIVDGAVRLANAVGASVTVCIEDNKPDAIALMSDAAADKGVGLTVLPTRYPQGSEKQLIRAVTGRTVPRGGLPADVGVLVSNVATAAAASDAARGIPLTHRLITVAGDAVIPINLWVPIGTPIGEVLDAHLFSQIPLYRDDGAVVIGGPMTGTALTYRHAPILKTTAGLIYLPAVSQDEMPCIRCGACVRRCPMSLMPFAIDEAERAGDDARFRSLYADQCIACGCCSYVCPARRELMVHTVAAREIIRKGERR